VFASRNSFLKVIVIERVPLKAQPNPRARLTFGPTVVNATNKKQAQANLGLRLFVSGTGLSHLRAMVAF
jgi:hypothetical protein